MFPCIVSTQKVCGVCAGSRGKFNFAFRGPNAVLGAMKPDPPSTQTHTHVPLTHPALRIKTHVETIQPMP